MAISGVPFRRHYALDGWHEEFCGQKEHKDHRFGKGKTSSIAQTQSCLSLFLKVSVLKPLTENQLLFSQQHAWFSGVHIWHIIGKRDFFLV